MGKFDLDYQQFKGIINRIQRVLDLCGHMGIRNQGLSKKKSGCVEYFHSEMVEIDIIRTFSTFQSI